MLAQNGIRKHFKIFSRLLENRLVSLPSQDHASEPSAPPLKAPRNPYKGLKAFGVEDAHDFFG